LFVTPGEVLICVLPLVSHTVVVGPVLVHSGTAAAGGAAARDRQTATVAKTAAEGRSADMVIDSLK
jgi:hypothetical protein